MDARQHHTPRQQRQLDCETRLLQIDPVTDPDAFVRVHNELLGKVETGINTRLPGLKRLVIDRTASRLAGGDKATQQDITRLLEQRLSATAQVVVEDTLIQDDARHAFFDLFMRVPVVASDHIAYRLETSPDIDHFNRTMDEIVIAHELLHGLFTSALQTIHTGQSLPIRNGLSVTPIENPMDEDGISWEVQGDWLSESVVESFRQTIMGTEEAGYRPGVMVVNMLDELSPGLRDRLMLAGIRKPGPGPAFAEVEAILGPTIINDMPGIMESAQGFVGFEAFKDTIAARLPSELRSRGRLILDQQQGKLHGWIKGYNEAHQRFLDDKIGRLGVSAH